MNARLDLDALVTPFVRNLMLAVAITLISVFASSYAASDLPVFDFERAKTLSADKRRQYDLVFFNEIATWQYNTQRFSGSDANAKRKTEFQRMAADGYLPAYVAIRLLGIWPAEQHDDPEALDMLLSQATAGDVSAMCALLAIPSKRETWRHKDVASIATKFELEGVARGHGACMAYYGGALLLGNSPRVKQDRNAAMPLLLESARQGYFVAASRLFHVRFSKALNQKFDFNDKAELARALCWGRLAQQHTNWTNFETFLELLRNFARANNRSDLMEQSYRLDPQRIPIIEQAVKPDNCIQLEHGAKDA